MSHDGSYADHIAVAHMAKMLGITITIVEGGNETIIGTGSPSVMLGYIRQGQHYVSLTPISYTRHVHTYCNWLDKLFDNADIYIRYVLHDNTISGINQYSI